MAYPPVLNKKDFVRRYAAGEFGNRPPTWKTLEAFLEEGYNKGLVHLRNQIAGGPTWYNVPPDEVAKRHEELVALGVNPDNLYISAMAPGEETRFQGEVMQSVKNYYLHWSPIPEPMRPALKKESYHDTGIRAVTLLRYYLCPVSYDWLQVLLDRYPFHVVEFSVYEKPWGIFPHMNTIFWEVRYY